MPVPVLIRWIVLYQYWNRVVKNGRNRIPLLPVPVPKVTNMTKTRTEKSTARECSPLNALFGDSRDENGDANAQDDGDGLFVPRETSPEPSPSHRAFSTVPAKDENEDESKALFAKDNNPRPTRRESKRPTPSSRRSTKPSRFPAQVNVVDDNDDAWSSAATYFPTPRIGYSILRDCVTNLRGVTATSSASQGNSFSEKK